MSLLDGLSADAQQRLADVMRNPARIGRKDSARRRDTATVHGTRAGFLRHWRAGESPCPACRAANRDHERERRRRVLKGGTDDAKV